MKLKFSLSMIGQHIDNILHDANENLGNKLKNNSCSIQVDKPTYLTNKCHVMCHPIYHYRDYFLKSYLLNLLRI